MLKRPFLFTLPVIAATLVFAGCDDRECTGYNDCGDDAFCNGDGICVDDPIGVRTTRVGVFQPPGAPPDFASGDPTANLSDESYLDGDFGLMPMYRQPATWAGVYESDLGTDIWIEWSDEDTGEWAMLGLWTDRPRDEVLRDDMAPVMFDSNDPNVMDWGGVVCSDNMGGQMFDEGMLELTILPYNDANGAVYELAAVTSSILPGFEARAQLGAGAITP